MQDEIKDEWIEVGARAMCPADFSAKDFTQTLNGEDPEDAQDGWRASARDLLAAVAPLIRAELEAENARLRDEQQEERSAMFRFMTFMSQLDMDEKHGGPDAVVEMWISGVDALRADLAQAQAQNEALRKALEKMQRSRDRYRQAWEAEKARAALKEPSQTTDAAIIDAGAEKGSK